MAQPIHAGICARVAGSVAICTCIALTTSCGYFGIQSKEADNAEETQLATLDLNNDGGDRVTGNPSAFADWFLMIAGPGIAGAGSTYYLYRRSFPLRYANGFSNRETGGLATLDLRLDGFTTVTPRALKSLGLHLLEKDRVAFDFFVDQMIENYERNPKKIISVFLELIARHNRWQRKSGADCDFKLRASDIVTAEGMQAILYKIRKAQRSVNIRFTAESLYD